MKKDAQLIGNGLTNLMGFRIPVSAVLVALITTTSHSQTVNSRESLTKELDTRLAKIATSSLIPGFGVAIVTDRGKVLEKCYGFSDLEKRIPFSQSTVAPVASVSKTVIALAVMKLVEMGKLRLDDPIQSILPFGVVNPFSPESAITVRHLVTHTSSITDSFEPYSVHEADVVLDDPAIPISVPDYLLPNVEWHRMSKKISLSEALQKFLRVGGKWNSESTFAKSAPGTEWQYSNIAASLAGLIVEIRSGMSFDKFTQKHIFEPLKMKSTVWNYSDIQAKFVTKNYVFNTQENPTGVCEYPRYYTVTYPSSGLKTTISDMSKFLVEMIRGAHGKGVVLRGETYKSMLTNQLTKSQFPQLNFVASTPKMAVFWSIESDGNYEHLGGNTGVYAFVRFDPKSKTGSLGICNLRDNIFGDVKSAVVEFQSKFGQLMGR